MKEFSSAAGHAFHFTVSDLKLLSGKRGHINTSPRQLDNTSDIISFAIFCQFEKYHFSLFNYPRHAGNRLIQRQEKIIPVNGNNKLCFGFFNCFPEECPDEIIIFFRHTRYTKEQHVSRVAVQLAFNIIKARSDQEFRSFRFNIEII